MHLGSGAHLTSQISRARVIHSEVPDVISASQILFENQGVSYTFSAVTFLACRNFAIEFAGQLSVRAFEPSFEAKIPPQYLL